MNSFGEKETWAYPGTAQIFWVPPIISGRGKATDFKFGQYIQRVHPNKSPLKILRKVSVGVSRNCPFSGTPYYLRNGKSYSFQIWPVHPEGPSEQKPIFREKEAWAYPGTAHIFWGTPYYLRNGKSYGFQIWPVHSEGPSEQKKRERGRIQGLPNFFGYPISKAAIFKFCTHIYRLNRNKSPLKISVKVAVGIVRDSRKFSRHPYIYGASRGHLCVSSAFLLLRPR